MTSARVIGFVYPGLASRDLELPLARFRDEGWEVELVGETVGDFDGFDPLRTFRVDTAIVAADPPQAIVVPGGFDWRRLAANRAVTDWLQRLATAGTYIIAVSTGALVVAAAGLLEDRPATGHWLALDDLAAFGAHVEDGSLARTGRVFTAGGALGALDAVTAIAEELRWNREETPT